MKAIEIFKSHQGEGRYTGTLMTFIRFKICKRPFSESLCSMCDTLPKMNNCLEMEFMPRDLANYLKATSYNVCFTGGEPTLYLKDIEEIINYFYNEFKNNIHACIHFETNGFDFEGLQILLHDKIKLPIEKYFVCYSPKFFDTIELEKVLEVINQYKKDFLNTRYTIKLVVGESNFDLIESYLKEVPKELYPNIYLLPEGYWPSFMRDSMKYVSRLIKKYNVNISDRLHVVHSFM